MRLRAYAKINLGLDILGKRPDGYHEVKMIMQTIQMYDLLEIKKKKIPGIGLISNVPYVPADERNLAYKAAKLLMDEFKVQEGLSIKLEKFIPVAAGMAGGSSDAAAVMVGVNRLFQLGLTDQELMERSVQMLSLFPVMLRISLLSANSVKRPKTIFMLPAYHLLNFPAKTEQIVWRIA